MVQALSLLDRARALGPELVALRRDLHRVPELDRALPRTQALVLDALAGLAGPGFEVTTGAGLSSVTAVLRGGAHDGTGPVVLLRGDMDALPVREETGLPFASEYDGRMHACGHDLHVAGLVGAARLLHERRHELAGDVVLMFQPAEETTAGALAMIEEGVLAAAGRPASAAYCLHVMASGRPLGTWFSRPGPLMAASDEFVVRVVGVGGHGSAPHLTRDPIPVACEMVTALQTLVTRRVDIDDPVVVTVGRFAAGTKENIIPDEAVFEATIRSFSPANRVMMEDAVLRLLDGIASAHGLRAEVEWTPGYPPTVNDPEEYAFARDTLVDLFGADAVRGGALRRPRHRGLLLRPRARPRLLRLGQRLLGRRPADRPRQPLRPSRVRRLGAPLLRRLPGRCRHPPPRPSTSERGEPVRSVGG